MRTEQRQFSRIAFDAPASVHQGGHAWQTKVVDLSLKGVLLEEQAMQLATDKPVTINITLDPDTSITMNAHWVHAEQQRIGFRCEKIDLDSITHLRRLVELNIGDSDLLERELSQLG